ncbi:hypothetical protein EVAR_15101_1 [Eumeta japonica]|uniref:Uncharacterized protein n=1 Tax=Eumeta variegata TaxID=151549 RepID=A0A4C1UID3_EUMVA|nr:hypothetical protein EVAR_15101_1 [Eumeta japonica]
MSYLRFLLFVIVGGSGALNPDRHRKCAAATPRRFQTVEVLPLDNKMDDFVAEVSDNVLKSTSEIDLNAMEDDSCRHVPTPHTSSRDHSRLLCVLYEVSSSWVTAPVATRTPAHFTLPDQVSDQRVWTSSDDIRLISEMYDDEIWSRETMPE